MINLHCRSISNFFEFLCSWYRLKWAGQTDQAEEELYDKTTSGQWLKRVKKGRGERRVAAWQNAA